jgi:hypothetical protein
LIRRVVGIRIEAGVADEVDARRAENGRRCGAGVGVTLGVGVGSTKLELMMDENELDSEIDKLEDEGSGFKAVIDDEEATSELVTIDELAIDMLLKIELGSGERVGVGVVVGVISGVGVGSRAEDELEVSELTEDDSKNDDDDGLGEAVTKSELADIDEVEIERLLVKELEATVEDEDEDTAAELDEALLWVEGALLEVEHLLLLRAEEVTIGVLEQEFVGRYCEEEEDISLHLPAPGWHPCPQ